MRVSDERTVGLFRGCPWCGDKTYSEWEHDHGATIRRRYSCASYMDADGQSKFQSDECKIRALHKQIADLETVLAVRKAEIKRLLAIVEAAWEVRREERDYNKCPDLLLRATARERLHKLLDAWKAAEAAKGGGDAS